MYGRTWGGARVWGHKKPPRLPLNEPANADKASHSGRGQNALWSWLRDIPVCFTRWLSSPVRESVREGWDCLSAQQMHSNSTRIVPPTDSFRDLVYLCTFLYEDKEWQVESGVLNMTLPLISQFIIEYELFAGKVFDILVNPRDGRADVYIFHFSKNQSFGEDMACGGEGGDCAVKQMRSLQCLGIPRSPKKFQAQPQSNHRLQKSSSCPIMLHS